MRWGFQATSYLETRLFCYKASPEARKLKLVDDRVNMRWILLIFDRREGKCARRHYDYIMFIDITRCLTSFGLRNWRHVTIDISWRWTHHSKVNRTTQYPSATGVMGHYVVGRNIDPVAQWLTFIAPDEKGLVKVLNQVFPFSFTWQYSLRNGRLEFDHDMRCSLVPMKWSYMICALMQLM